MNSAAEWVASIPAEITARDALTLIDTAVSDAKTATDEIVARFSGTLPPPPWPRHPELVKAVEALEGGKLLLMRIINDLGHGEVKRGRNDPQVAALVKAGQALYREIGVMQKNMQGIKAEDLPALAAAAVKRVAGGTLGGLFTFAVVLWAISEFGGDD